MTRPTYMQINADALRHNLKQVRKLVPSSRVLAMIKANAYGHGLINVAHALADADAFGVAFLEEALQLRAAGIQQPIVLMEGFYGATELAEISQNDLAVVVHQYSQLEILEQQELKTPLTVWLKIDTGLHRLGFLPEEVAEVWRRLKKCKHVGEIHLLSHFTEPDDLYKSTTLQQLACFDRSIAELSAQRSLANSAAILAWPATHYEWVRPGIMLYGVSPFADKIGADHNLQPVMTLRSELIAVQSLCKGDTVGYGGTWICPENMPVGIIAIGYGDGYPRHAKNGTPVLVNNAVVPLIGRVSMDMIAVDLRTQPHAKIGDSVVLWGEGLPVEQVAHAAGTIAYELLCHVTPRVRKNN